jgi:hypothetical protein
MRWLGTAALLSSLVALSACGMAEEERSQPAGTLEPAPPIEAIDEPAPHWPPVAPDEEGWSTGYLAIMSQETQNELLCPEDPDECKPTAEQVAALHKKAEQQYEDMRPAEGTKPRAIARLASTERPTRLIAWRTVNGELCMQVEVGNAETSGTYGPFGPCAPFEPCDRMCLNRMSMAVGDGQDIVSLLGGSVAANGDELRVVFEGGTSARYPLTGPLVPGFDDTRVFLLDLGERLYQRLELLDDDEVIASTDIPRREIEAQKCFQRFPLRSPPPTETAPRDPNPELEACLRATPKDEGNG